ncbi:MAG: SGNH/GDSL hydrolase family protein [Bacteroidota bacterium]
MTKPLKFFLVTVVMVGIILSVIELLSRVILHRIYNRNFDSSLIVDNKYFASPGLKENAAGLVWGKPFNTDEFGGRRTANYNSKKKKWLFLGDSVTEGVGVDDSSTFASLCSKEFPEFNVLNCSLIGYSTSDYYNVLRSVLQNDTAVELVSLFYCLNDVYGNSAKDLPVMSKQNFVGTANAFLQNRCAAYKLVKLFFYHNSDNYFKYDSQFYAEDNPRFKESMNYIKQSDSLCRSKNIFFQVVMLPYKSQLKDYGKANRPQQLVKQFCNAHSISFSDAALPLSRQTKVNALYLFADEIHFSDKGHRAIAEYLSE